MATLDREITIRRELRPCLVYFPFIFVPDVEFKESCIQFGPVKTEQEGRCLKALFHAWNQINGKALVEYEDGTIDEVEPTCIQFVDNAISEYAFPQMENSDV